MITGWDRAGRGALAAPNLGPEVAGPLSKSGPAIEKEWFLHGDTDPQMQGLQEGPPENLEAYPTFAVRWPEPGSTL